MTLTEKIHEVRSMAGTNTFTVEGAGWLAEICELAERVESLKPLLLQIAYPRRGTNDDYIQLSEIASEIQESWSLEYLEL